MREDGLDPMHFFTAGHIRPNREFAKIIAPFYENVTADETYGAMRGMVRVHHLLQATSPVKRWVVLTALKAAGTYDVMHGWWRTSSPTPDARPATRSWKHCISRLSRWQCGSSRNMWKGSPTAHRWTRPMTTPSEILRGMQMNEAKQKFRLTSLERAWILYDVGNSAFVLLVATLIPIFFNALAEGAA